jgi:diguanylate cyclase (GGDEF)-like protein
MAFNDRLSLALSVARRSQGQLAILLLDLDNFKDVNDSLGHDSGDKLLKEAGDRLRDIVRKHDIVARMGGDEFMLLITEFGKIQDVQVIAEKILSAFRTPFEFNGHQFNITTSIGIATFPKDGDTAEDLKKHADIAMYRAKDLGRDKYQFYG